MARRWRLRGVACGLREWSEGCERRRAAAATLDRALRGWLQQGALAAVRRWREGALARGRVAATMR
eukprot:1697024-Prymnesium_polylepis.1